MNRRWRWRFEGKKCWREFRITLFWSRIMKKYRRSRSREFQGWCSPHFRNILRLSLQIPRIDTIRTNIPRLTVGNKVHPAAIKYLQFNNSRVFSTAWIYQDTIHTTCWCIQCQSKSNNKILSEELEQILTYQKGIGYMCPNNGTQGYPIFNSIAWEKRNIVWERTSNQRDSLPTTPVFSETQRP